MRPPLGSCRVLGDALDRGAAGRELLLDPLVAAVEVVDARHPGLALGGEAGEDQADQARRSVAITGAPSAARRR